MTEKYDENAELQRIETIETEADAIEYLITRGFTRDLADKFVRALAKAPDDPSWPRKEH